MVSLTFCRIVTSCCAILTFSGYSLSASVAQLDRGHRILMEKGLQIEGICTPYMWAPKFPPAPPYPTPNLAQFLGANFTGMNFFGQDHVNLYLGAAPGIPWSRTTNMTDYLLRQELPYLPNMVTFAYQDEIDITNPTVLENARAWLRETEVNYPNVIAYTNLSGGKYSVSHEEAFIDYVKPHMVTFDAYSFQGQSWEGQYAPAWYSYLSMYRHLALRGIGGDANCPLPYGLYLQTFVDAAGNGTNYTLSPSEMRLNQFSAWAFGYTWAVAFVYTQAATTVPSVCFEGLYDTQLKPNGLLAAVTETNRQSRNIGKSLVRLISTDVRAVVGQHKSTSWPFSIVKNNWPVGISPEWATGADPYIKNITVTNPHATLNDGLATDVIVGYFKPLVEEDDGPNYQNEIYFMIVNGLCGKNGVTPEQATQNIHVDFDFGTSGINKLLRVSRNTGNVELVPLISDGDHRYHLDLTLDGGTGDLFKFDTGAAFAGFMDCDTVIANGFTISGDLNSDCKVDMSDLYLFMKDWLRCYVPTDAYCEQLW